VRRADGADPVTPVGTAGLAPAALATLGIKNPVGGFVRIGGLVGLREVQTNLVVH
jgi:hypothetical protein